MTTITTNLNKLVKRLQSLKRPEELGVPAPLLENVRAVIFCKKIVSGTQREASHPGIFMKRLPEGGWSNPVALHFLGGTVVSWHALGDFDLMLFVLDDSVVHVLETVGQCGLDQANRAVAPGMLVQDPSELSEREARLRANPELLKCTYAYHVAQYALFPASLKGVVLQFRPSSNEKYYDSRNASLRNIMKDSGELHTSASHEAQIAKASELLDCFFSCKPLGESPASPGGEPRTASTTGSPATQNGHPPPPPAVAAKGEQVPQAEDEDRLDAPEPVLRQTSFDFECT